MAIAPEVAASAMLAGPLAVGLAGIGPAIGIGLMTVAYFNSVARQPEIQGNITPQYFITLGVVELLGLFGFVAFAMLFFKFAG
jgi:F-type H+-transporting ATPase subunit c